MPAGFAFVLAATLGCGQNAAGTPRIDAGCVSVADAAGPAEDGLLAPERLSRPDCEAEGWDAVDLDGTIWSLAWGVAVRFAGPPATLTARLEGAPASAVTQNASTFFWRASLVGATLAFRGCHRTSGTEIDGILGVCVRGGAGCHQEPTRLIKIERRPGELEASPNLVKLAEYGAFPVTGTFDRVTLNVRVDAARGIAALARGSDGLRILATSTPGQVWSEVGHGEVEDSRACSPDERYNDVKLVRANGRDYALLASSTHGVVIWEISDPRHPILRAHVRNGDAVHTHFVLGNVLYAADLSMGGLLIADVSDPTHPVELGQFILPNGDSQSYVHDLYVEPGRAYLAHWDAGLVIIDVGDPHSPRVLGQYRPSDRPSTSHSVWITTIAGRKIAVSGDEGFGAYATVLDVTDPASIHVIGEWGQDRPQVSIHNILVEKDKAYVAWYQDGLRVLQLYPDRAPEQIGYFNSWSPQVTGSGGSFYEGAIGIDKVGDVVYLADALRGLLVLKVL
jgi:hypothetical protein